MIVKATELNSLKEQFLLDQQAWMREYFSANRTDEEAVRKVYKDMPSRVRAFKCWLRVNHLVSFKEVGHHQLCCELMGDDVNIMKLVLAYDLRPHQE